MEKEDIQEQQSIILALMYLTGSDFSRVLLLISQGMAFA